MTDDQIDLAEGVPAMDDLRDSDWPDAGDGIGIWAVVSGLDAGEAARRYILGLVGLLRHDQAPDDVQHAMNRMAQVRTEALPRQVGSAMNPRYQTDGLLSPGPLLQGDYAAVMAAEFPSASEVARRLEAIHGQEGAQLTGTIADRHLSPEWERVNVTPSMEEAGLDCLFEMEFGEDWGYVVRSVYLAMEARRLRLVPGENAGPD